MSYLFAIMYHNMQKLNKAELYNIMLFLGIELFMVALFAYFHLNMELIIGIGISIL